MRRGKTVFFATDENREPTKGMLINLTPRKKHATVATTSKDRPVLVPLNCLREPSPLPLKDQTFVLSGSLVERGDKEKLTTEKVTSIIEKLGGNVYTGDVEKAADASFVVITSQKELNKATHKVNKTLIMAYRLGWQIVSKKMIIEARDSNITPSISNHLLDITAIRNAPDTDVVDSMVFSKSAMINNHQTVRGHWELKKQLRMDSNRRKRDDCNSKLAKKHPPKKPCTAYVTFSKEMWKTVVKDNPSCSMREVNSKISELWNTVSEEERQSYQIKAQETFAQSVNSWNSDTREI